MSILTCLLLLQVQGQAKAEDFPKALQTRVLAATVLIANPANPAGRLEGSGVIVGQKDKTLYILTAYHVVQEDNKRLEITIFTQNPKGEKAEKTYRFGQVVAKIDGETDLALVEVAVAKPAAEVVPIVPLGETIKEHKIAAMSVGCGRGVPPTCQLIDAVEKKRVIRQTGGNGAIFWQSSEKAVHGRSGGPLVNSLGQVVGICSGASEGKSYYTHIDEIHRLLTQNDGYSWLARKK